MKQEAEKIILNLKTDGLIQNEMIPPRVLDFDHFTTTKEEEELAKLMRPKDREAVRFTFVPAPHGDKIKKCKELEGLEDQIVVELGPGWLGLYYLINDLGAKGYIGVEPYWASGLWNNLKNKKGVPLAIVKEDALTFLKRVPDKMVSLVCAGLEVIQNKKYLDQLRQEMRRVLHPAGMILMGPGNFKVDYKDLKKIRIDRKINIFLVPPRGIEPRLSG